MGERIELAVGPADAGQRLDVLLGAVPQVGSRAAAQRLIDEGAVTVDGRRHPLPDPLFVVATQNPLEYHGTYPLPEGQLDRFAIAMGLGYVPPHVERDMIKAQLLSHPIEDLEPVLSTADVAGIRRVVRATHVSDAVLEYALSLVNATRSHPDVELGASPRASISLIRCAQARALVDGREFVVPDDVKSLAVPALAHRVMAAPGLRFDPSSKDDVVRQIVDQTPVPVTRS